MGGESVNALLVWLIAIGAGLAIGVPVALMWHLVLSALEPEKDKKRKE